MIETIIRTLQLLPVAGVVDILGVDIEFSSEGFYEGLGSICLEVGRCGGFAVCDDADSDGLAAAVPGFSRDDRPLSLPFFSWQDLAVIAAEAVTYNEVTVDVF